MSLLEAQIDVVRREPAIRVSGRVASLRGLTLLVDDLPMPVGSLVCVRTDSGVLPGEVVGFTREQSIIMLLTGCTGVRPGDRVVGEQVSQTIGVSEHMLGRIVDGLGRPIDGKGLVADLAPQPLDPDPVAPMRRRPIREPICTGVRVVDLMATLGRGQRMGVFAGPGVGKSTLLGQVARFTSADVSVIALIGERGREVRDFVENALGPDGLARSVVVVATGDESPVMRVRAAKAACAAAEFFRDRGRDVMLMMDSVTRFAHACRQVGLSAGEPPATRGYTPSVFAALARLLERAGAVEAEPTSSGGSITGLYAVLVEGDDLTEPVSDAVRGILDGHIILSRRLAQRGHYPAVDVLDSVSRVADEVCDGVLVAARRQALRLIARYREVEELVQIGAYASGSDPEADVAIARRKEIDEILCQSSTECGTFEKARERLVGLMVRAGEDLRKAMPAGRNPPAAHTAVGMSR
ncbi:MAG: FliI/YscN family ATPase [Phycisphaeraceae bacterium]|nr:FliI/YscN family ATPase [Phycisphaeraceae bacterium]